MNRADSRVTPGVTIAGTRYPAKCRRAAYRFKYPVLKRWQIYAAAACAMLRYLRTNAELGRFVSARGYYQSLLTLHDVDRILASSSIRPPEISFAKNGKNIPFGVLHTNDLITQAVMHDALFEQYREGAIVILQFLHERWQPLVELSASLAKELSAAVQAKVYVTPKNAQGLCKPL